MKTKHKFYLLALLLSLQSLSIASWAVTTTPVDSMFQVIKGDWYHTRTCTGMTGKSDSVYSSTRNEISRGLDSDNFYWKTYENDSLISTKVCTLYKNYSILRNESVWFLSMQSDQSFIPYIIDSDGSFLSVSMDVFDRGWETYSRVMNERAPSQARIDSVAQCLAGDWYKVYNCMGSIGFCDSVYSEMRYSFAPVVGTDSVVYTGTTLNPNQVGNFYVKCRIIETANNISNRKSWMLQTEMPTPSPDGIHDLYTRSTIRYYISCANGNFSIQQEGNDTPFDLFSRSPRLATPLSLAIDSVAACIIGNWYKVAETYPMSGQRKPFYSKNKNEFKHSTGSSTINWVKYDDVNTLLSDVQYKLELNADSSASGYKWKLIRVWPMADCVNLNNDFLLNCKSDTLDIQKTEFDLTTTTSIYARNIQTIPNRQATIDSIASLLVGNWYKVSVSHGISDVSDSVYSSKKYTFEHKIGTDTLGWNAGTNDSTQAVTYKLGESFDSGGNLNWVLTDVSSLALSPLEQQKYSFGVSTTHFDIQERLPYIKNSTYARSPRLVTPSVMKIDSVANCLEGEWYLKAFISGSYSVNLSPPERIIITHEDSVAGILATLFDNDSISGYWDYGVQLNEQNPSQVILRNTIYPSPDCGMIVHGFIDDKWKVECNDSIFKMTHIEQPANYQIYSRENPNNGAGIKSTISALGFSISPNPVKADLHIEGANRIERVKLLDLSGIVLRDEIGDVRNLSLSSFNKGIYLLQVTTEGKTQTIKLIKE